MGCQTWCFILNVIICYFLGGGMVMWTTTHSFDFFLHVILCIILSQYVQTYRPKHEQTNIPIRPAAKTICLVIPHVPARGGGTII